MTTSARSPLPPYLEPELQSPRHLRATSVAWIIVGLVFLAVFALLSGLLHWHNQQRKPLDFWGFDSHRVIGSAPVVRATLIKPDPLVLTPQTPGDEIWHDNLFVIVENRYLVEGRADVVTRPEFRLTIANMDEVVDHTLLLLLKDSDDRSKEDPVKVKVDDAEPEVSLRRALRSNESYDWQAFPWAQQAEWRYALTFAKEETTSPGTKHALTRTFTFTLVFDSTCRWVTLQSVEKMTALHPDVQQRFKKFFLEVFPDSDAPPVAPVPTATPTGSPLATGGPAAAAASLMPTPPSATGPSGTGTTTATATPATVITPAGAPAGTGMPVIEKVPASTLIGDPMPTTTTTEAAPKPLQLSPSPLLRPSAVAPPPTASPSGTFILPAVPTTAVPSGTVLLPTLPTTTSKTNP